MHTDMGSLNSPNKIDVVLIEDIRLLREGLAAMINAESDLKVAAAFENGEDVCRKVCELKPDVVLWDIGFEGWEGLSVVRQFSTECAGVKSIVMHVLPQQTDVMGFIQAGVSGFFSKEDTFEELLNTIRSVAGGNKVLPRSLTGALFSQIVDQTVRGNRPPLASIERLTSREHEVMVLIAYGQSNKEIAQELNLATFTVKSHVHNILEKLALNTRVQVASCYAFAGAPVKDSGGGQKEPSHPRQYGRARR
jgi:DNA-binding NarL/FixJ family response regulator